MDPTTAALILAGLIIVAIVAMTFKAASKNDSTQKNMFAVVGLLAGILAGGGVGTILGGQAGEKAADDVKDEVKEQVKEVGK